MQGEENMFHLQCVYGVNYEDVLEVFFRYNGTWLWIGYLILSYILIIKVYEDIYSGKDIA